MKNKVLIIVVTLILIGTILGIIFANFPKEKNVKEETITSIKLSDVNLICNGTDTEKLIRYNGILYGKDLLKKEKFDKMPYPVAVVDKLLDSDFLPIRDLESNSNELLGAKIANPSYDYIIVINNDEISRYNAISVDYKGMEVTIKDGKIYNEILIDDFFNDMSPINYVRESKLIINNNQDKYIIENFLGENDKAYNKALEEVENGGKLSYSSRGVLPDELGNPIDETLEECRRIYGYYRITKNDEEPIEFDSYTHVLRRKINTQEARNDISKGIITLYFDMPYANTISNYTLCDYELSSSNYTSKFTLNFKPNKDIGIKSITHDEDYNLLTCGGEVYIKVNNTEYTLEEAINQNIITKHDLYSQALIDHRYHLCSSDGYFDGGSTEYYYPKLDNTEGYTILKLFSLDENRDIYIGPYGPLLKDIIN